MCVCVCVSVCACVKECVLVITIGNWSVATNPLFYTSKLILLTSSWRQLKSFQMFPKFLPRYPSVVSRIGVKLERNGPLLRALVGHMTRNHAVTVRPRMCKDFHNDVIVICVVAVGFTVPTAVFVSFPDCLSFVHGTFQTERSWKISKVQYRNYIPAKTYSTDI